MWDKLHKQRPFGNTSPYTSAYIFLHLNQSKCPYFSISLICISSIRLKCMHSTCFTHFLWQRVLHSNNSFKVYFYFLTGFLGDHIKLMTSSNTRPQKWKFHPQNKLYIVKTFAISFLGLLFSSLFLFPQCACSCIFGVMLTIFSAPFFSASISFFNHSMQYPLWCRSKVVQVWLHFPVFHFCFSRIESQFLLYIIYGLLTGIILNFFN